MDSVCTCMLPFLLGWTPQWRRNSNWNLCFWKRSGRNHLRQTFCLFVAVVQFALQLRDFDSCALNYPRFGLRVRCWFSRWRSGSVMGIWAFASPISFAVKATFKLIFIKSFFAKIMFSFSNRWSGNMQYLRTIARLADWCRKLQHYH